MLVEKIILRNLDKFKDKKKSVKVLIGKDFDKIEISVFGLDLVEPNAFLLAIV